MTGRRDQLLAESVLRSSGICSQFKQNAKNERYYKSDFENLKKVKYMRYPSLGLIYR